MNEKSKRVNSLYKSTKEILFLMSGRRRKSLKGRWRESLGNQFFDNMGIVNINKSFVAPVVFIN